MPPLTVLHVIPTLKTGGAEHMLASLVTAKRKQEISQAVVELTPGGEVGAKTRAAAMPVALVRLIRLIRRLKPSAIQSWLYYADLLSLWALDLSGRRALTRLYWGVRCSDIEPTSYRLALRRAMAAAAARAGRPD